MRGFIKFTIDCVTFLVGISAFVLLLVCPESKNLSTLTHVASTFCICYILRTIYLSFRRPLLDWHLLHGSFLRKVICFVLLMPFLLTDATKLIDTSTESSAEFVYDENLYKSQVDTADLKNKQVDPPLLWSVYYHFIDPGNQHMTTTSNGRGWAALIAILGVFLLNGLLVSSIIGYVDTRKEKWLKGELRYNWFLRLLNIKGHYVIIGGNDMTQCIVNQLLKTISTKYRFIKPYILIQTSRDVESFRRELYSTLTEKQQQRIIIYYGNRNSEKDLKELCLYKAIKVYILGEETRTDDIESYHDTMNMECLSMISDYLKNIKQQRKNKLECRVMFEYQTTFSVFQFYDIDKEVESVVDFKPFNYYDMWAQKVFINREIDTEKLKEKSLKGGYLPLEGYKGVKKEDNDYVHLFIVGMSRMGVAMAIEAAHLAHYPNYSEEKKIRTKITFIDKNAAEEKDFFMGRFKELFSLSHYRYGVIDNTNGLMWQKSHTPTGKDYLGGDFLDIEWEFINGGIEQTDIQNYILETTNNNARITIAICLPESNRSHASALYLHKKIYESESVQQVLVYNRYGNTIINALHSNETKHPYLNKLKSFGSPEECFDTKWLEQSEEIGKAINDRYTDIEKLYINVSST